MDTKATATKDHAVLTLARRGNQALLVAFSIGLLAGIAGAQTQPPVSAKTATSAGAYDWFAHAGLVCGAGTSNSSVATRPTVQCRALFSGPFFELETGVMGPQANQSAVSGYLSTNLWIPLMPWQGLGNVHGVPLLVGGYTRMLETGHALDYGVAYAHPIRFNSRCATIGHFRIRANTTWSFAWSGL